MVDQEGSFMFGEGEQVLVCDPDLNHACLLYCGKILSQSQMKTKEVGYKVSLAGYNTVYPECKKRHCYPHIIPEGMIFKANQRCSRLQKKLFRTALAHSGDEEERCNAVRKILTEALAQNKIKALPNRLQESAVRSQGTINQESENESDEDCDGYTVSMEIPDSLKKILIAERRMIKQEHKIPENYDKDVVSIFQSFLCHYASQLLPDRPKHVKDLYKPETRIELTKEVLEGLRVLFDILLPTQLLYSEELSSHQLRMQDPKKEQQSIDTCDDGENVEKLEQDIPSAVTPEPKSLEPSRRQTRQSASEAVAPPPLTPQPKNSKLNRILLRLGAGIPESNATPSPKRPRLTGNLQQQTPISGRSTPTNVQAAPNMDSILKEVAEWRLLPKEIEYQATPLPCVKYGANHLLRLFVKLSPILTGMKLPDARRSFVCSVLEALLSYLKEEELSLFT